MPAESMGIVPWGERVVELDLLPSPPMDPNDVDEISIRGEERSESIHVVAIPCFREFIHRFSHGFLVGSISANDASR